MKISILLILFVTSIILSACAPTATDNTSKSANRLEKYVWSAVITGLGDASGTYQGKIGSARVEGTQVKEIVLSNSPFFSGDYSEGIPDVGVDFRYSSGVNGSGEYALLSILESGDVMVIGGQGSFRVTRDDNRLIGEATFQMVGDKGERVRMRFTDIDVVIEED